MTYVEVAVADEAILPKGCPPQFELTSEAW
jgi:hypothetical protein